LKSPTKITPILATQAGRMWVDVQYAPTSPAQRLDIYLPAEGDGPFPVIFHIHGGAFAFGDKRDQQVTPFLKGLARGYAVISLNYRLSGEALFPAGLQDIKAALRWVRANAGKYHLDGGRIAACGGSAGGYYAAMTGLTTKVSEFEDLSLGNPSFACNVQAVVDWFGPTDFLKMDEHLAASGLGPCDHSQADSPESRLLGKQITLIPDLVQKANPLTYVQAELPPFLIEHGNKDHIVPYQQSLILAEKIENVAGKGHCEMVVLDGADHADAQFETDENIQRVLAFLDKHLK
jgi:acetyl esterase/lipase